jgi:conjugative relaxase-like TrwC/TraI family protein
LLVFKANDIAIGRVLDEIPLVRKRVAPGPTGVAPVKAENYVGVQVMHTTARMTANDLKVPDPQLHVHNLLIGAVTPNGELRALDSKAILDNIAARDAEASAYLAAKLQERGFELEWKLEYRKESGQPRIAWEMKGVPASLIQAMSQRSAEIEDLKAQYRKATGREAQGPSWDAFVVAQRGQKAKLGRGELRVWWQLEAEDHGFDAAAVGELVAADDERRAAGLRKPDEDSEEAAELRRLVLGHVCKQHAFVPVAELERLAWQLAVTRVDPRTAGRVIGRTVGDGDLIVTADGMVTTLEVLAHEQQTRRAAAELLAAPPESPVAAELVEAELERRASEGAPFDEHREASLRLAVSGARFVSISGKAGTGKSHMMAAMSALWHGQGRRVIATAVPGRTAQKAAVDSNADVVLNLDQFRVQVENGQLQLTARDVVLAEEAGQIDHHRYAPLVEAVSRSGATLVQLGDDRQLSPVGPGGLWTVLHRRPRGAGRAAQLRVVYRAHAAREAEAWDDLRAGRIARALTWIHEEGRLRLYETRPELRAGMVEAWWAGNRDGMMIVDTSNEERDQSERAGAGEAPGGRRARRPGRPSGERAGAAVWRPHSVQRDLQPVRAAPLAARRERHAGTGPTRRPQPRPDRAAAGGAEAGAPAGGRH